MLINRSLKHLNLEMNNITDSGTNIEGVRALADALKKNVTLIWLNLNSTCMDDKCSQLLVEAMKYNTTLIHMDIEGNPNMDIYDVRKIQEKLMKNRKNYYAEREREFKERRYMGGEKNIKINIHIE